ncbi:MAG: hypothetical protein L3J39_06275 [Verrucomicrobiales bacterium]|nr:hypothetical protein [Verrucomicrobiales bacterium]
MKLAQSHSSLKGGTLILAWILLWLGLVQAGGLKNVIPDNQKPLAKIFPPSADERANPGQGKFVIFTREPVGKGWDFIAAAWECIPSRPDLAITKRVEFCHSSWNATALQDVTVADGSHGLYPRYVKLQVDSGDRDFHTNLYDIDYRSWDVKTLWQGHRFRAFGTIRDRIFCHSSDGWVTINAHTGKLGQPPAFIPLTVAGNFWIVKKSQSDESVWSYDPKNREFVAEFKAIKRPDFGFAWSRLSTDGKSRAWIKATAPEDWRGGSLMGELILQRANTKQDILIPVELQAYAGSGVPVIPDRVELKFSAKGNVLLRVGNVDKRGQDRLWSIGVLTGKIHSESTMPLSYVVEERDFFDGVPLPEYLQKEIRGFDHFGRGGLAPAFLLHLGILKEKPQYPDCHVAVSPSGRHIFYKAKKGPLAGVFIYGDLLNKKAKRFQAPDMFKRPIAMDIIWVDAH